MKKRNTHALLVRMKSVGRVWFLPSRPTVTDIGAFEVVRCSVPEEL